ncbi:MAG: 6-phosphogluconolactonase [Actinomycetota bacterium]
MDILVSDDPAGDAATFIARKLVNGVRRRGSASLAVSGGSTPQPMLDALAATDLPWKHVTTWQVDERIAPDHDSDRNADQLDGFPGTVRLMPVTAKDLRAAARRYAASLPERFDVIHLGLGDDGHTASWPPGDADVLHSTRPVDLVGEFHGRRRMTLTPPVVNAARARLVLAAGTGKSAVVERWLLRDPALPINTVRRGATTAFLDSAAAADAAAAASLAPAK